MRSRKGFTLIEILIVMVILGTLSSLGGFAWSRYVTNNNLRAAARDIETDFSLMRKKAQSNVDETYTMTINQGSNNYTLSGVVTATGASVYQAIKSPTNFQSGIVISNITPAGVTTITFLTRGTTNPSAGTIVLTNSRNSTATITYNTTGRTHVTSSMQ